MRILARPNEPAAKGTELDWIESRVRLLGESFGEAARKIQDKIDAGAIVVVDDPQK